MPKADKKKKNGESRKDKKDIVKKNLDVLSKDVDGTVYGQVVKILGDCNFTVYCFDGKERMCHIRKSIKRTEKAEIDSIVLVGPRDFSDDKGDIVYIYTKDQASELRRRYEIPSKIVKNTDFDEKDDDLDDVVEFDINEL